MESEDIAKLVQHQHSVLTAFLLSLALCCKKYLLESFLCKKLVHFSCQEFMVVSCIYITR